MRNAIVYVAGPFRGPDHWAIAENIRNAERLALRVWQMGATAICPHANTAHYQNNLPDDVWLDGDLAILRRCDAVLMTPDWRVSQGATAERDEALKLGIPVFEHLDQLRTWLDVTRHERPMPSGYQRTTVLGIGHRARQGKDTVARMLIEEFPGYVHRVSFADALRGLCRVRHGMTRKDAPLLQRVGVSERERDRDVWVRAVAWQIDELDRDATERQIVVITDVRFQNEADFVARVGGTLCKVERLDQDGNLMLAKDRPADHISEIELADYAWPYAIRAVDGDTEAVRAQAVRLAETLL